ncbi:MAG: type 1 glutamine amidotransferase [Chthoniobacter sp.]|nr:type 1 glutamine amidotransferase [Chthoniobacter sp.]
MTVHSLEHQSYEGPGRIADWAAARGHTLARTALYASEALPALAAFDLLVVMGGSMNIYEHRVHPWLVAEKAFLAEAVAAGKPVLGICLGAQLLADLLGGKVVQNPEKEIGWWPVRVFDRRPPFNAFPERLTVMHWHGDTFTLPPGARRVAESDGCVQQAFVHGDRVVGLQFHLEQGPVNVTDLATACAAELVPARYVQTRAQLATLQPDLAPGDTALFGLLDALILHQAP